MRSSVQRLRRARVAFASLVLTTACGSPPQTFASATDASPTLEAGAPTPMAGFSWVHEHHFAAMPQPGRRRALSDDLSFLRQQEIKVLVSLTVTPVDSVTAGSYDIFVYHIPIPDFTAPTQAQIREFVFVVESFLTAGVHVGVHCGAGLGRTGTMVATYFVSLGMTAADAIALIRALRPGSIETDAQEQSIYEYAACGCFVPDDACVCGQE